MFSSLISVSHICMLCCWLRNTFYQTLLPCLRLSHTVYPSNLPSIPSSFSTLFVSSSDSLSLPVFGANTLLSPSHVFSHHFPFSFYLIFHSTCYYLVSQNLFFSFSIDVFQSVIVKSVERNAVNMYEARKFLLGLESNGVSCSSHSVALNPATNGPSPSLICPVGLEILASAGLGLSNLGNDTNYLKSRSQMSCYHLGIPSSWVQLIVE